MGRVGGKGRWDVMRRWEDGGNGVGGGDGGVVVGAEEVMLVLLV